MADSMRIERRSFEFRVEDEAGGGSAVTGVVIPYDETTRIGRAFQERFVPGSVRYDDGDVVANVLHDRGRPLARTGGGGLSLSDGPTALRCRIEMPDTADGRDTLTLIRRGVLRGLSAEFRVTQEEWSDSVRTIKEAVLYGLGIVDRAAYAGATLDEIRMCTADVVRPPHLGATCDDLWPLL